MVDQITFSDEAAKPWNANTSANLLVDGQVVRSATGQNGAGLDWASWDLRDLQGKQAQVQLVDNAVADWGHLVADYFTLADQAALSVGAARALDRPRQRLLRRASPSTTHPKGQRLMIGWMSNWDYAQTTPTGQWRGQQSVVRRAGLTTGRRPPTRYGRSPSATAPPPALARPSPPRR